MRWYRSHWLVRTGLLALLGVFAAAPLLWLLIRSFENPTVYVVENVLQWIDRHVYTESYGQVLFHDLEYWTAYWNTLLLTLPTLALAVCVTAMAAYGLTVIRGKLQGRLLFVYAILSLLPAQVLLVPHLIVLDGLQLSGSRLAVILVGCCSPWYVFFLHRLCRRIPEEIFETARMEGAGEWTVFRRIALPQMRLGLLIFGIVVSADLWGMVEEPLVYIQDVTKYPMSVLFHEMETELSQAGVLLFALPVILVFLGGIREALQGE